MVKTHTEPVAIGPGGIDPGVVNSVAVNQLAAVTESCCLDASGKDIALGIVIKVVAADIHPVVEKVTGSVQATHPRAQDAVSAAEAAASAHAAHAAATAAHSAHHIPGEVIESSSVGIVGVENQAEIGMLVEPSNKGSPLITEVVRGGEGTGGLWQVTSTAG